MDARDADAQLLERLEHVGVERREAGGAPVALHRPLRLRVVARRDEHRLWHQLWINTPIGGGWAIQSRTRFEHRFAPSSDDVAHRFRQFVRLGWMHAAHPVGFVVWDELFLGITGADWGAVEGYAITALESPRASITTLSRHFGFDAVETEGVIRFIMRGRASVATLGPDDLVAAREGDVLLVIGKDDEHYVIGVLHGTGQSTLTFQGGVDLRAQGGPLTLSSDRGVAIHGPEVEVDDLIARVSALLRRVHKEQLTPVMRIEFGRVTADFTKNDFTRSGVAFTLTTKEADLLRFLATLQRQGEDLLRGISYLSQAHGQQSAYASNRELLQAAQSHLQAAARTAARPESAAHAAPPEEDSP